MTNFGLLYDLYATLISKPTFVTLGISFISEWNNTLDALLYHSVVKCDQLSGLFGTENWLTFGEFKKALFQVNCLNGVIQVPGL